MTTDTQPNTDTSTPSEQFPRPVHAHGEPPHKAPPPGPEQPVVAPEQKRGLTRGIWIALIVVAIAIAVVVAAGILSRSHTEHTLVGTTDAAAIPTVSVIYPKPSSLADEIALPGNTQGFVDTPIYARTSGYLKSWYFDIGARVHKGQLIAVIETPELDQQLQQAEADLKSTQANLDLANITAARYQNLLKSNSVSKQETDVTTGDAAARKAAVEAAQSNVRRLEQLKGFENIYAPYDGVITARNTDIGDLIQAGANSAPKELFHIASISELRVFVSVPEAYAPSIKNGDKATLTLDEYPGKDFVGTVTRNSSAIDSATRTLNVEVDIPNPKGELLPGAYVFVHFKVPQHLANLMLPANTLLFRSEGLQVGIVKNGRVHLQSVTISRDAGATVEIGTGVTQSDAVIVDPSDSLANGQRVTVSQTKDPALDKPGEGGASK